MIQARKITRTYHTGTVEIAALDEVDLDIGQGEMVSIMGPSGSGKTTLLNCLSGLDEVSSGDVIIDGIALGEMSDSDRTKYRAKRMGFVFQAFNLLPVFSALENVELPMLLGGKSQSEAHKLASEALDLVGLSARAKHKPAELSGGEQQRTAIARAISSNPAVVWADEPTGNLDSENAERIIDLLVRLNQERGLTVVMVTHDSTMGARAERTIRMRDGKILG